MLYFKKKAKKNICLIGLMGSGKSMIAREISKLYNINYLDSDKEIEKKVGKSINNIFINDGEEYFRKIEEEICLNLLNIENIIVLLGGGSICNNKIRRVISKNSHSIYLKVDIDILVKRLKNSNKRPLLLNVDKKNKLEDLYEKREKFYNKCNLVIENNFDKQTVINKIKMEIANK